MHDAVVLRYESGRMLQFKSYNTALHHALTVGESHFWRGYTHGKHRNYEMLATGNRDYPASGPPKGVPQMSVGVGRLPR